MSEIYKYIIFALIIIFSMLLTEKYIKYRWKKIVKKDIIKSYGTRYHLEKEYVYKDKNNKSFFENTKGENFYIDDITWNDLEMESIFEIIGNTRTSIGREVLYKMLRTPSFSKSEIEKRENLIKFLSDNEKERFNIQVILSSIGFENSARLSDYFKKIDVFITRGYIFNILRWSLIIFIFLSFINLKLVVLLVLNIIVNIFIHFRIEKLVQYRMKDYMYMNIMINNALKIYKKNIKEINDKFDKLDKSFKKVKDLRNKRVGKKEININNELEVIGEYFKIITLSKVVNFIEVENIIKNEGDSIREIYEFIGSIDSFISIASFRKTIEYSNPKFEKEKIISFKEIYNPLIKNPIKNSLETKEDILITGSNASGKSTFLRSIGLNCILAQTINTVCAKEFKTSFFKIYSSMALSDNIFKNESYYIAEIKSIKRILDGSKSKEYSICFIDEVLRGTNTLERIAASTEILNMLSENEQCICFGATHDIELTYILENKFKNYNFEECIEDNRIRFDYKLKKGPSKTRNAIKMLELIGYDKQITETAEENIKFFIKNNKWKKLN